MQESAKANCVCDPLACAYTHTRPPSPLMQHEVVEKFLNRRGGAWLQIVPVIQSTPTLPTSSEGVRLLHRAIEDMLPEYVELLLARGVDPNGRLDSDPYHANSLLRVAVTPSDQPPHRLRQIVRVLVAHGARSEARPSDWKDLTAPRPLYAAVYCGNSPAVSALLEFARPDINVTARGGETALHVACAHGKSDIVDALIEAGASLDAPTDDGFTPLDYAVAACHDDLAERLRLRACTSSTISHR